MLPSRSVSHEPWSTAPALQCNSYPLEFIEALRASVGFYGATCAYLVIFAFSMAPLYPNAETRLCHLPVSDVPIASDPFTGGF
jgi:hypothetical protein